MSDITVFIDSIGRTILGQVDDSSTDSVLAVRNPSIVNVNVGEDGQISVQLFPYVFREFLVGESRTEGVVWQFNKSTLTVNAGIELDDRLTQQYQALFIDPPVEAPVPEDTGADPEVVELFDDEDAGEPAAAE